MTQQINLRIEVDGEPNFTNSQWLQNIRSQLEQELEISCTTETIPAPDNTMDAGLTVAVGITLSLTLFNTVLALVKHYRQQSQRNTLTYVDESGATQTRANLSDDELEKLKQEIKQKKIQDVILRVGQ